jgi:hypothetical protein
MSFAERIAEALAGTQSIAVVGDSARDDLYRYGVAWGFRLASVNAANLASFGEGHELWGSKSRCHWLLVVENCEMVGPDQEDNLLDLLFDGAPSLPANTLIAAHFGASCTLAEMLNDENVPVSYLEMTSSEMAEAAASAPAVSHPIAGDDPDDLSSIPLAA